MHTILKKKQRIKGIAAMLVSQTKQKNSNSVVEGTPTWSLWRQVKKISDFKLLIFFIIVILLFDDLMFQYRRLVSPVGKAPVYRAGGLGSIPGRANTQGLKITEEKVLPLL